MQREEEGPRKRERSHPLIYTLRGSFPLVKELYLKKVMWQSCFDETLFSRWLRCEGSKRQDFLYF